MPILSTKPSALNFLYKIEIMKEVIRREKEAGITPDPNIDTYMKVNTDLFCYNVVTFRRVPIGTLFSDYIESNL